MNARSATTLFGLLSLGAFGVALAQTPAGTAAGTEITNQASATFTDSAGNPGTALSNEVSTFVQSVYAFEITPNGAGPTTPGQTESVIAGEQATFEYNLTNNGNDTDTFSLSVLQDGGDNFTFTGVSVYLDNDLDGVAEPTDGNGVVDPGERLIGPGDTFTLAAGGSIPILVLGTVPSGTANNAVGNLNLVGVSAGDPASPADNQTDDDNWARATAISEPTLTLDKEANQTDGGSTQTVTSVVPGDTFTYTMDGSNTGSSSPFAVANVATVDGNLVSGILISDDFPTGLDYVAGSLAGSYTAAGATASGLELYSTDNGTTWTTTEPTSGVDAVAFLIQFPTGTRLSTSPALTYSLSFDVTIPANTPPTDSSGPSYSNIGVLEFDRNGDADSIDAGETVISTPPTDIDVEQVDDLDLGPFGDADAGGITPATYTQADADGSLAVSRSADTQTVTTVDNGRTATFRHSLTNTGNLSDTFTLTSSLPTGFPAGSVVFTTLAGAPITNLTLAAGATGDFLVVITIPETYVEIDPAATTSFTITATSANDATVSDPTTDVLGDVTENDFAAVNIGNSDGNLATAPSDTSDDFDATAGTPVNIPLELTNGGNIPDTFDLTNVVPNGWIGNVFLADGNGNPVGGPITTVGPLEPGENVRLVFVVTPPVGTSADDYPVSVTATSQFDPANSDTIENNVVVGVTQGFTFSPDAPVTTPPGSQVTYTHTATNGSNAPATVALAITEPGTATWTYEYGLDANQDGDVTDPGDVPFGPLGAVSGFVLAAGDDANVLVRVSVPADATDGLVDNYTLTATPTYTANGVSTPGTAVDVTDVTTVAAGVLELLKSVEDDPTTGAVPGSDLVYTIVADNSGTGDLTNVKVSDPLPEFTDFVSITASADFPGTVLYATAQNGPWSATLPSLAAGQTVYVGVNTDNTGASAGTIDASDVFPGLGELTITFTVTIQ